MRALLQRSAFGQIGFCRKNVFTMLFVVDPSTEEGMMVLGFMADLFAQGIPIRFAVVLAPGASRRKLGVTRPSPYEPGSRRSRLASLAGVYAEEGWRSDRHVAELTAALPPETDADADGTADGAKAAAAAKTADDADLGLALTKLFFFCKRKLGSAAAMRFLAATREAREVGGGFFGPPEVEPLEAGHLREAIERASAATRKQLPVSSYALVSGVIDGSITDFDDDAEAGLTFLQDKGIGELPALLTNGVLRPLTGNIEAEVSEALTREVREVANLVRKRVITDETEDMYGTIANATSTFARYNKDLLVAQARARRKFGRAPDTWHATRALLHVAGSRRDARDPAARRHRRPRAVDPIRGRAISAGRETARRRRGHRRRDVRRRA